MNSGIRDIQRLQCITSSNEKSKFIKEHSKNNEFKLLLYYTLNPLLTYNLSENTLTKDVDDIPPVAGVVLFIDIFDCCEQLSRLRGIDDATVRHVRYFLYNQIHDEEERNIYIKLLSKTLRLGVTAKTVNKIFPNFIPEWEVQQAYPIEKYPIKSDTEFWLTQKLNGVRATYYDGQLIARSGFNYRGLDHIVRELCLANVTGFVLDGELTLKNKGELSDNEAFRVATGILNSDEVSKPEICYTIFDIVPVRDFESNSSKLVYSERRELLDKLSSRFDEKKYSSTSVLPVLYHGTDLSKIDTLLNQMVSEDKEGLMVNTNVPYRRSRHKGILKVKRFYTMDLRIIRCEEGSGKLSGMLGAFVLEYNGNEVKCGSGFSDGQRRDYWNQRDMLPDAICEVKYKEISSDKSTGLESLQFPVFVQLRYDKSEVNYE